MTDRTLPLLPHWFALFEMHPTLPIWREVVPASASEPGVVKAYRECDMTAYALAALAPLEAENAALRASVARLMCALTDVVDRDWTYKGKDADPDNPESLYRVMRRGRQALIQAWEQQT